jgi:hypothetical protein
MQAYGQPFDQVPTVARRVQSGIAVSVRRAGAKQSFWRFSTGSTKSKDLVTIRGAKKLFINTGVQTFFDFIVTYSDLRGTVVLVPLAVTGAHACLRRPARAVGMLPRGWRGGCPPWSAPLHAPGWVRRHSCVRGGGTRRVVFR